MSSRVYRATPLLLFLVASLLFGCSSEESNPVVAPPEAPVPQIPEFFIVSDTSPTFLRIQWEDVSDDETGFRIERSIQEETGFAELDTVAADVAEYTDGTVEAGGRYFYRVRAFNESGDSEPTEVTWGDAVSNASPAEPSLPAPPDGAQEIRPDTSFSWTGSDEDGDVLTYRVHLGTSLADIPPVGTVSDTFFLPPDTLDFNRSYFWRIQATDPNGASTLSPIWSFSMQIERLVIEAGWFVMGDTTDFRHPGNPIWVDAFSMDKFEVTNQQYADFLNDANRRGRLRREGGRILDLLGAHVWFELQSLDEDSRILYDFDRRIFRVEPGWEDHPVVEVSWFGAQAYAEAFSRWLPSEAEWEKAARGTSSEFGDSVFTEEITPDSTEIIVVGVGRPFPWGGEITPAHANYESSGDPFESALGLATTPVGFYDGTTKAGFQTENNASQYGVFDLAGNAYEWVDDWLEAYHDPHAPPADGRLKVIRGGSWNKGALSAVTWIRNATFPDSTDRTIGFRTAGPPGPP
jgi:formylglycine-generating enzyme required for sulfatase activity